MCILVFGFQLSVFSFQLSVFSFQLSDQELTTEQ